MAAPYIMVLLGSWQRDRHQVETGWRRGRAVTKEECSVEPNRSQSGNTGIPGDATGPLCEQVLTSVVINDESKGSKHE